MTRLLLACLAVTVLAAPASAAPGRCVHISDVRGDVSTLMPLEPERADLLDVRVVATARDVTATFLLAGRPEAPLYENLQYTVELTSGETTYQLAVDKKRSETFTYSVRVRGGSVEAGQAGTDSWERLPAAGSVDVARRTATVRAAGSLGRMAEGRRWTVTHASAWHGYGTGYGVVDNAYPASGRLVAGDGRCRR